MPLTSWEVKYMTIKRWISSGESEQFEDCTNEQELFERLEREIRSFKGKLGTVLFVDGRGDVFSVNVAFTLALERVPADGELKDQRYVFTLGASSLHLREHVSCEHCLSESVNECGICLDCGHANHCPPIPPKKRVTSGRSH